jgi:hypothetical protein
MACWHSGAISSRLPPMWLADDGQVRHASVQFDGYLPHWQVAVYLLVVARKTAVYGRHALDTGLVDALHGPNPQFKVGVYGVFDEYRHVGSPEGVGQCLHGKRVGRRACSHPQYVDAVFHCQFNMLWRGYLCGYEHSGLFFHGLHPRQGGFSVALETSRLGARFPHSGSEHLTAFGCELHRGGHHLFFCLGRAGACHDERAFVITWQFERF